MTTVDVNATVFGEVLSGLMESRGIDPTTEETAALAERTGMDPGELLARIADARCDRLAFLRGRLIDELRLTRDEATRLALAFAFEERRGEC